MWALGNELFTASSSAGFACTPGNPWQRGGGSCGADPAVPVPGAALCSLSPDPPADPWVGRILASTRTLRNMCRLRFWLALQPEAPLEAIALPPAVCCPPSAESGEPKQPRSPKGVRFPHPQGFSQPLHIQHLCLGPKGCSARSCSSEVPHP